ncbi:MAG: prolyl oligopeptidase family serine peptidase [Candidatus Zixiibacteriota bacterium]
MTRPHLSSRAISCLALLTLALPTLSPGQTPMTMPPVAPARMVVDTLHGVPVSDPYRWLEDWEDPGVQKWTFAQNDYTRQRLQALPGREALSSRLESLLKIGFITPPHPRHQRYFYTKREGDQNQPLLLMQDGLFRTPVVLIDPNSISAEGIAALDWWYPSDDGKFIAYGVSRGGSEISTLYVLDVDARKNLPDTIPYTRAASLAWDPDNVGFYYTRHPAPGTVPEGEEAYHRHVFYHTLGTNPADDPKVWGEGRPMDEWPGVTLSEDGRLLLIQVYKGATSSELYIRDLYEPDPAFDTIVAGIDALFGGYFVKGELYVLTNHEAPNFRVMKADPKNPGMANWTVAIPEDRAVIETVTSAGERLVLTYLDRATSRIKFFTPGRPALQDISLPGLGSVYELTGSPAETEIYYGYSTYFQPPAVYRYDFTTGQSMLFEEVQSGIDATPYVLEQVTYNSKDGTEVTMFLVHRKGITLDGNNPVLLYGYGGFSSPITPGFQRNLYLWLEQGGVYAAANLRGGNEYGEAWHRAGMLDQKQNVYDDFIAAAEWLINNKYTSPDRLAIMGGSNGGLLVGAVMVQRPELFRAVVCSRPLLDMVRYDKFLIAKLWIPEYGTADSAAQFPYLYAYSPYHNIKEGVEYPATLILTADTDTRVDPLHARKFAARLQEANASENPILLWVETQAGHGQGAPLTKTIAEYTDIWSFIMWQLGVTSDKGQ